MGVQLTYAPAAAVPPETAARIAAEARELATSREWWCEPIYFIDEQTLDGSTKIFLPGYSTAEGAYQEVDADDDSLMAAVDASFIFDKLAEWSQQFGITWSVGFDGDEIGRVGRDGGGEELLEQMMTMASGDAERAGFDEERIREIRARYASRLPAR